VDGSTAAVWSAIAATFSAISAAIAIGIQRQTLRTSNRPELLLLDWQRTATPGQKLDLLCATRIQNVGRGTATHGFVVLRGQTMRGNLPLAMMDQPKPVPVLAAGAEAPLPIQIHLHWSNVKERRGVGKVLSLNLTILSWDVLNRRHEAVYRLTVFPLPAPMISSPTAPGVFAVRVSKSRATWSLKAQRAVAKRLGIRRWSDL
jgi:hypothetical protein